MHLRSANNTVTLKFTIFKNAKKKKKKATNLHCFFFEKKKVEIF